VEGPKRREREKKKGELFEFQGRISAGMGVCVEEKLTRHDRGGCTRRRWEGKSLFVDAHVSGT
jgi:hypothetical protein